MNQNSKIKVKLTFEWEITPKEWKESTEYNKDYLADMEQAIKFDHTWAWWVLNNIRWPNLTDYKIEEVK